MGIPLIALPVFGDQPQYAARAQREGYGLHLDWMSLTEDSLFNSIQEIINNPKYTIVKIFNPKIRCILIPYFNWTGTKRERWKCLN